MYVERFKSEFTYHGSPLNKEWEKYPKLKIIISLLGPASVGKSCLAVNAEYSQALKNNLQPITIGIDMTFFIWIYYLKIDMLLLFNLMIVQVMINLNQFLIVMVQF